MKITRENDMKLLVSDYDGTISIDGEVSKETIDKLRFWVEAGNLFVLATGRSLNITTDIIEKDQLPVDYIICNNGSVTYDANYKVINESILSMDIVNKIVNDPIIQDSHYFVLSEKKERYLLEGYQEGKETINYYTKILKRKDLKDLCVYAIDTRYDTAEIMKKKENVLRDKYAGIASINPNIETIDFTPRGVTKDSAVQEIANKYTEVESIIAVGDGLNDLAMIKNNIGYTMEWATQEIKDEATGVVSSINEVIDKHI